MLNLILRQGKVLLVSLLLFLAIFVSFHLWLSSKYVVPIIMYHSIDLTHHLSGTVIGPANFERQMNFLKTYKYNVISLNELVTSLLEKKKLPKNSVVITFDDGYADNYTNGFRILKKYGFPATVFVIADLIDHPGYLTWRQLREMEKFGITTGSHTLDHVYLPGVPLDWQVRQIKESKRIIERKLGYPIYYFAYPSGGFSDGTKDIVEETGYKAACTTNRGNNRFNEDVYELKRVRFSDKDYEFSMWMKLSGYYNLFRVLRPGN